MVKIRLTRGGAKKRPFYHIIVTDSRSARDGRNIERVGFYNPVAAGAEKRVELNTERVQHWLGNGAQLTDKVAVLYKEALKSADALDVAAVAGAAAVGDDDVVEGTLLGAAAGQSNLDHGRCVLWSPVAGMAR